MATNSTLSDRALSVFAFAAFHQFESGQPVKKVIREDGKGHQADHAGVEELTAGGFATLEGNDIVFSDKGLAVLKSAVDGLRSAAQAAV